VSFDQSVVLIVPADRRAEAEEAGRLLGYTDQEYAVELSPSGEAPATHYALHSWARQAFTDLLTGSRAARPELASVLPALTVSIAPAAAGHFEAALAAAGLKRVTMPPMEPPPPGAA
jgi:hypothetical protein